MLKKLRLTLLMSSVMFFPKGLYAADQDEDFKTIASKPTSSSQRDALSLLPAFARNVDADPFAGPSSSQAGIGSSSSGVDLSADEFEELTEKGRTLYAEVLKSNVEVNIDLTKYFNAQKREELEEILTIIELLKMDSEKPLNDIEEKRAKLIRSFIKLGDQKVIQLHLDMVDQLDNMLENEVPIKDFLSFCSDVLKDPKFQGSKMPSYVNLMQQAKFMNDFFEKVDEIEDFTEATLANLLKEIPENSKNFVKRVARPYFKMMNLGNAMMQTFPYENEEEATYDSEEEATYDSSSPYSNGEVSAVSAAPVASSSTPAPAMPALELDTREFHMGQSSPYPTSGFSGFEGSHRWTLGKEATISFSDMTPRPSRVSFLNTGGLITTTHTQELLVKVNGNVFKSYVYAPGNNNHTLEIPLPKDGPAIIEFEIPTAASPSDLGINPDKRVLGILFRKVQFSFD